MAKQCFGISGDCGSRNPCSSPARLIWVDQIKEVSSLEQTWGVGSSLPPFSGPDATLHSLWQSYTGSVLVLRTSWSWDWSRGQASYIGVCSPALPDRTLSVLKQVVPVFTNLFFSPSSVIYYMELCVDLLSPPVFHLGPQEVSKMRYFDVSFQTDVCRRHCVSDFIKCV